MSLFTQKLLPKNNNFQKNSTEPTDPPNTLINRNWQKEDYIGLSILLFSLIAAISFFSRRFEYALIFALTLSIILIAFFLTV
ncbi:hypothetical protein VB711_02340 [Cronbergia sp. UHCC 0137]|uniref:hypothetical protein n=1 Tax=Cronbergia sp. UHCC 0137 TaxID=3110239 RepID=UPI002B2125DA|nr:hypothetical protein [Cronbergia sp. UHCC 0137]MEA5616682.1 hypothetical protein [Cronbergia sp. UHCC 0137]